MAERGAEDEEAGGDLFAGAAARARRGVARKSDLSSDVSRAKGFVPALAVGAVVAAVSAAILPPAAGHVASGPVSRPHAKAKVACDKCHSGPAGKSLEAEDRYSAAVAGKACSKCHGSHPSIRRGHAALADGGKLGCPRCHGIHQEGEGITFVPGKPAIHFGAGFESEIPTGNFTPGRGETVALVRAGACAGCHDLAKRSDPAARCFSGSGERGEVVRCLDEHRPALIDQAQGGTAVCSAQHGPDRPLYWDAALALAPSLSTAPPARQARGFAWMGLGLAGFALTWFGSRVASRARRSKAPGPPPAAPIARAKLPIIDTSTCLGCYACVDACPYGVLEVERYVAKVVRPEACCGLVLCEQRCPNGSLRVADEGEAPGRPALDESLQSTDVPGLWLAGDVTGVPLIKNAIRQGEAAMRAIAKSLDEDAKGAAKDAEAIDVLVVGAGPAGIGAALAAKELGLACEVLEQGTVAQSIRSFPRGKLVFDQPLDLPVTGKLWLKEASKEELLANWLHVVRKERIVVHEDTRMTSAAREGGAFVTRAVEPGGGEVCFRARRLLVAVGQRGTPRRLPIEIPEELESRVHYHLADARSFAGQRVVVVGLGDVAMETAVAIARQPGAKVTVLARSDGFRRGSARNVDELKRLSRAGLVDLRFRAELLSVDERLRGRAGEARIELDWDALFVLIGSLPPRELLERLGVSST